MNPYFFFGFHILRHFNVTYLYPLGLKIGLYGINYSALKFYISISRDIKKFSIGVYFNAIYLSYFYK